MNKIRYIVIVLINFEVCQAQNLVSNSSFELLNSCSSGPSAIKNLDAPPWESPTDNTADVFDSCSTFPLWSVPSNFAGNQIAHSSHAYAGATFYPSPEYLQIQLENEMVGGNVYCVSFYINLGGKVGIATKNIGVYISTLHIQSSGLGYLNNYSPQIIEPTFIFDTLNWRLISGQYNAIGGERYLIIGQFSISANDTMHVNPGNTNPIAYYYIDDVNVYCCSSNCVSGIDDVMQIEKAIDLYPNPFTDNIDVSSERNEILDFFLYDTYGKQMAQCSFLSSATINTAHLARGVYIYEVKTQSGLIEKGKVVKD